MSERLTIPFDSGPALDGLAYVARDEHAPALILAHGAGAGQRSRFMTAFADALQGRGITVITFDFPYIQQRRKVPDRAPVLEAAWRTVLAFTARQTFVRPQRLVIGGKSMGGRIASHVAAETALPGDVRGLVLLGYPLHPPGRRDQLRTAHLPSLTLPVCVVQGERDSFGTPDEVRKAFSVTGGPVDVTSVPGGDHSFKMRRGGEPQATVDERIREHVAGWIKSVAP